MERRCSGHEYQQTSRPASSADWSSMAQTWSPLKRTVSR